MPHSILIRKARQLLTLQGPNRPRRGAELHELGLISDGSVLIIDGKIAKIGSTRRIENLAEAQAATEIDATGRVVMPAFVDSRADLLRLRPCERQSCDPARALHSARRVIENCIRHGTATTEVRCGAGADDFAGLRLLRSATKLGSPGTVVPVYAFPSVSDEGRREVPESAVREIGSKGLATAAVIEWDHPEAERYASLARRFGLARKVETAGGDERSVRAAIQFEPLTLEGLHRADPADAEVLARSSTIAVLFREDTGHRAFSYGPARTLVDAGAAVALATAYRHSAASTFSMQTAAALAALHSELDPAETLQACTINAAYASGVGHRTGSIEYQKDGDLIVLGASDYREIFDQFGANLVETVIKGGRIAYRQSEVQ